MDCHGGTGRPTLTEVLRVHFIVASKIIHINQKSRHIHDIGQCAIHAFKNILYIVNDCSSLHLNIQPSGTLVVHLRTGDRIVCSPRTDTRYEQIIPGSTNMGVCAARRRFFTQCFRRHAVFSLNKTGL